MCTELSAVLGCMLITEWYYASVNFGISSASLKVAWIDMRPMMQSQELIISSPSFRDGKLLSTLYL